MQNPGRLYEVWIGIGLTIAGLTGIAAWLWGRPFLTSAHIYVSPPILGEMHLASRCRLRHRCLHHRCGRDDVNDFRLRRLASLEVCLVQFQEAE